MKVRVILEDASIFKNMDTTKKPMAVLHPGREFNLGKVYKETSEHWVEATLADGRRGYVTCITKLRVVYPVTTSRSSSLFKSDNPGSEVLVEIPAHTRVELLDVADANGESWSLVRLADGREGYLPPEVNFKREGQKKKRSPRDYALFGSAAVLLGIFLRRLFPSPGGNSPLEMIAWAGILAGGALIVFSFFMAMQEQAQKNKPRKRTGK
jgi:hypothetical protein